MKKINSVYGLCLSALFAAFIAVCSQIQIPLPMIPINLALFAVYTAGAVLGVKYGTLSVAVYVLLGMVGVPVFANFKGGFGILFGKTGGYILGYVLAAVVVGALYEKCKDSFWKICLVMTLGLFLCYTFGSLWFMYISKTGLWATLGYCVLPFLPGDAVKIVLSALVSKKLKKSISKYIS